MAAKTTLTFRSEAEAYAFAQGLSLPNDSAIHDVEQRGCIVAWIDDDDTGPDIEYAAHEAGFGR
jgi:hypothetical protein